MFLLSDANFRRYGIDPADLARTLTTSPLVRAQALFLSPGLPTRSGDSGETAAAAGAMPPGLAHVVLDPGALPQLLRRLLAAHASARY